MINKTRIEELKAEVGEDDFAEVVELFFEEVEEVLDELDAASPGSLGEKLHFLKGSALNIGMDELGAQCRMAEGCLSRNESDTPNVSMLRATYEASKAELLA
ncbi:MAG: Hpt domain-containing protein [Pseudomonadota bacterium]